MLLKTQSGAILNMNFVSYLWVDVKENAAISRNAKSCDKFCIFANIAGDGGEDRIVVGSFKTEELARDVMSNIYNAWGNASHYNSVPDADGHPIVR